MVHFQTRHFPSAAALECAAEADMERALQANGPVAVMLSGGTTPRAIYEDLRQRQVRAASGVSVLFSDERFVSERSPDSNYGATQSLLASLGVPEARVLRVHVRGDLEAAAGRYHCDLDSFFSAGGRITLGWLGMGADGHTASLFSREDVERGRGYLAVAVPREVKPDRVSVTPDLLNRVERLVILAVGWEKQEIVSRLLHDPTSLPVGMALRTRRTVELWLAGVTPDASL